MLAQQADALYREGGIRHAKQVSQGGRDVSLLADGRGVLGQYLAIGPEDQRHRDFFFVHGRVVDEQAMLAKRLAMIADQHEQRRVEQA
ncbi:hypothetical protein D3C71_1960860 [compost metagenome]